MGAACSKLTNTGAQNNRIFKTLASETEGRNVNYLSQKASVFGEQTAAVLHGHVQGPSVQLHQGDTELKPEHRKQASFEIHCMKSSLAVRELNMRFRVPLWPSGRRRVRFESGFNAGQT